jgi:hypothetical protein
MTIERIYFEQENVVLTLIYDKLTNHKLTAHVLEMNRDYNGIEGIREIADCRYLFDVSELASNNLLVAAGMEEGSSRTIGGKGAIVVANDLIHGLANMYATIASKIRDDSRVYRSMNEALDWLEVEPIRHKIESLISEEAYQQRTASTDNQA